MCYLPANLFFYQTTLNLPLMYKRNMKYYNGFYLIAKEMPSISVSYKVS